MPLQLIGAGLPRTATQSLQLALQQLLGGRCYHMREIEGHPSNLGADWDLALAGGTPDWEQVFAGYVAAVDYPASMFWQELSEAYPDAPVLLSVRASAEVWYESLAATILPHAREALAPDWNEGRGLLDLLEQFAGTKKWDDPDILMEAYRRHNAEVRKYTPPHRLIEWQAADGWEPICRALHLPIPEAPFPWTNKREEWG